MQPALGTGERCSTCAWIDSSPTMRGRSDGLVKPSKYSTIPDVDGQSLTGATRLYEKAGMHPVYKETLYEKELRPGVELATQALLEADPHG